jgi:hypothetical protein
MTLAAYAAFTLATLSFVLTDRSYRLDRRIVHGESRASIIRLSSSHEFWLSKWNGVT